MSSLRDHGPQQSDSPNGRPSLIERAFDLAHSGECSGKTEIVATLKGEGYDRIATMLHGKALNRQLRKAITLAKLRICELD